MSLCGNAPMRGPSAAAASALLGGGKYDADDAADDDEEAAAGAAGAATLLTGVDAPLRKAQDGECKMRRRRVVSIQLRAAA